MTKSKMTNPRYSDGGILVFIPTFNDVELLDTLVSHITALSDDFRVLVIDDGSSVPIKPGPILAKSILFRLPGNYGLGLCTHIAFDHALRYNYRAVVRVDADGQHPVDKIPEILRPVDVGEADLVVATRTNRNVQNGLRGVLARCVRGYLSIVARLLTGGMAPRDVNSGFFVANRRSIEVLNSFHLERYPEPQMYILACRNGQRVADVEVTQLPRGHGESSVTLKHALRMLYRFNIFVLAELLQGSNRV